MDFYFVISKKNNGYPNIEELAEIPDKTMTSPYPHGFMICESKVNSGYPHIKETPIIPEKTMVLPYPHGFMICANDINDGYPHIPQLYDFAGAFENVQTLENIRIPKTVKKIGKKSFAGTSLKKVKISADCTYYATSFPADCIIEFY